MTINANFAREGKIDAPLARLAPLGLLTLRAILAFVILDISTMGIRSALVWEADI